MSRDRHVAVGEIFGPTYQGEGPNIGMPVLFLRLAGCNLSCVWCDTPYTWDWTRFDPRKEITSMKLPDLEEHIRRLGHEHKIKHLVVTGGEPLLQQDVLFELTRSLRSDGWFVEIETAGTIAPASAEIADQFNVSPKLDNSGNLRSKCYKPDVLDWFEATGRANFKFVVTCAADLTEVDYMVETHDFTNVILMPEGRTTEEVVNGLAWLAEASLARGYRLTTRMQIEIWGNERGR